MKLLHKQKVLGRIVHIGQDGPWMSGDFQPNFSVWPQYQAFFAYMTDERHQSEDPPFGPDLLDAGNWYLQDESGALKGIEVPAVHSDNSIEWRWR